MFNAKTAIFSYSMARTSYILMRWWWWCPICSRPTRCVFIVLAHWNNSPRLDTSTRKHYSDSESTIISSYCCVLSGEATNTNFIVFGISPPMRFRGNVWTAVLFKLQQDQFYIKYTLTPCFDNPYYIYLHPRWSKNKCCIMFVLFKMAYKINVLHIQVAI